MIFIVLSIIKLKSKRYFSKFNHIFIICMCIVGTVISLSYAFRPNQYAQFDRIDAIAALGNNKNSASYIGNMESDVYIKDNDYVLVLKDKNNQSRIITKPKYEVVIDVAPWVTENSVWEVETTVKYTTTDIWYYIPLNMDIPRKIIYVG